MKRTRVCTLKIQTEATTNKNATSILNSIDKQERDSKISMRRISLEKRYHLIIMSKYSPMGKLLKYLTYFMCHLAFKIDLEI